ncbi:MAG TPA: hypothetical protein VEG63_01660 [Candidatus Acidoferrales bacterium]|nr:hypothetical protein [Candidatus Acidoferrales bacterium]
MPHRRIATLAVAAIVSFLILSQYDPQFFLLHIYESAIYMVLLFLLMYEEEEWAFVLGMAAPAAWVLLISATNLHGILRQVGRVLHFQALDHPANFIGGVCVLISVVMFGSCLYCWKHERWGFRHAWRTIGAIAAVVAIYYGILVFWFSRLVMAKS